MLKAPDYREVNESVYRQLLVNGQNPPWSVPEDNSARIELFAKLCRDLAPRVELPRTLVLGCGEGEVAIGLAAKGFCVTGIDISPSAIKVAREKAAFHSSHAIFLEGNVLAIACPNTSFDVVIDDHCLHCIIGQDRSALFAEMYRIASDGGIILLRTLCNDPPKSAYEQGNLRFDKESRCLVDGDTGIRYFGLPESLIAEVETAGFRVISSRHRHGPAAWSILEIGATKKSLPIEG